MNKYDVFKGLTSYLIEGVTKDGGWGNECGLYQETNPLNTAECLCGLIFGRHHLLSKNLDDKYDKTIENAISYLLKTQLKSGGWGTGGTYQGVTDFQTIKSKGNMVSTCFSIMALCFYYEICTDNNTKTKLISVVKKSLNYLKIKTDNLWSYSPDLSEKNLMATAYALLCLSYLQANLEVEKKITNSEKNLLKNLTNSSIDNLLNNKEEYFNSDKEQMSIIFIFIASSNLIKANYKYNSLANLNNHLFSLIQNFSQEITSNCFTEKQAVRQKGKNPRDFVHYMPLWIIVANCLTENPINNFNVALNEVISNIDSNYQGCSYNKTSKRHTWTTGITLMGLGLLCDNFRFYSAVTSNIEKRNVKDSVALNVNPKKVFVVHGRDAERRNIINNFLSEVDLSSMNWEEAVNCTGKPSPTISEIISVAFTQVQAVIVLFTGDDEVKLKDKYHKPDDNEEEKRLTPQSRPNVIFEAGLSFGLNPNRTIFVQIGEHKNFSDLSGVHFVKFDSSNESKKALSNRLKLAECKLNEKYLTN
jgi:predicted nucleotide-binding protein